MADGIIGMVSKDSYKGLRKKLDDFLELNNLRKTEERYAIFDRICTFPSYFDIKQLYEQMEFSNFHVSRATLYNSIEIFIASGLLVRHQFGSNTIFFELKLLADKHIYMICTKCGSVMEASRDSLDFNLANLRFRRFTPESYNIYIYGLCSRCRYALRKKLSKGKY